jgi:hypothetical protein
MAGVRRPVLILLAVAAVFAVLPAAAGAWSGYIQTKNTVVCTPTLIEGETYSEDCAITVEETAPAEGEPVVPTAPTGVVEVNKAPGCTLVPYGTNASGCHYFTTAQWNTIFPLEVEYLGDETHQGMWSLIQVWGPGYPTYPPEIPARAPTAAEAAEHRVTGIEIPEPRIVTQPPKRTYEHLATFKFAGGEHYETALDQGRFRPSGASFSRHVSTGRHVLRVREDGGARAVAFRWRVLPRRG